MSCYLVTARVVASLCSIPDTGSWRPSRGIFPHPVQRHIFPSQCQGWVQAPDFFPASTMQSLAWLILCFLAAISASMPVRPDQAGLSRRSDDPSDAAGGKAPRLPGRPRGRPKPAVEKGYPKEFWKGRSIKGSPADPRYPFKDPLEEPPPFLWGRVELVNQCIDGMWRAWVSLSSWNTSGVKAWRLRRWHRPLT